MTPLHLLIVAFGISQIFGAIGGDNEDTDAQHTTPAGIAQEVKP